MNIEAGIDLKATPESEKQRVIEILARLQETMSRDSHMIVENAIRQINEAECLRAGLPTTAHDLVLESVAARVIDFKTDRQIESAELHIGNYSFRVFGQYDNGVLSPGGYRVLVFIMKK